MLKKISLFLILFLIIAVFLLSIKQKPDPATEDNNSYTSKHVITLGSQKVYVDIADTPQKQQKGLSGRSFLHEDEGMIFPLNGNNSIPSFWMKDMLIAIDILWIKEGKVVDVTHNAKPEPGKPDSELIRYSPSIPVDTVLELPSGYAVKNAIKPGTSVDLYLP